MSSSRKNVKIKKKLNIPIKEVFQKPSNEINFLRRTLENNTHEVLQDSKLKRITSWRKSKKKFIKNLIYNIFSLGILHLVSIYNPNLYIKLYCNPCHPKDCDYFLVEDIYGKYTLCLKIYKKRNNYIDIEPNLENEKGIFPINNNNNYTYNRIKCLSKNLTFSFIYKSMTYEYNDETNEIAPVYMNLSKLSNYGIINNFSEGLLTESLVTKYKERYGLNEYHINADLLYIYSKRVEVPNFLIVFIIGIIDFLIGDYISFIIKASIIIIIFFHQYIVIKGMARNLSKDEYTLDGEKQPIRVRRKYLLKDNEFYTEIKKKELLPGDIIFLKSNDIVPCDCLIMEGECIANESNSTGNLDTFRKTFLERNNELFNYKFNKVNILLHGMKISKTFSKLKEGFISVLCINTGANTYKANQYSNILYLSERRKDNKKIYRFFGENRKSFFIMALFIFFICIILAVGFYFIFELENIKLKKLFAFTIIRTFCKSLMPFYYISYYIIIILSVIRLKSEKILCYDKSRLVNNAGKIETIFFSKTGTLCQKNFEISEYHPVYINPHKSNRISCKSFNQTQCKEMNLKLLNYYKDYLHKKKINNNDSKEFNLRHALRFEQNELHINKLKNQSSEYIALFMECLLSCNSIDKFNTEIYGNIIETSIFNEMNWDIKVYDFKDSIYNYSNNEFNEKYSSMSEKRSNKFFYNNKFVFIDKKISDIFPKNYYKITESINNEIKEKNSNIKRTSSFFIFEEVKDSDDDNSSLNNSKKETSLSLNFNSILNNVNSTNINSYKLRVYKRFIIYGTLNSSAIVYNFLTKELRFMIKGMAEDILDKCNKKSLPDNFRSTISFYRKKGYIIIICATKLINIEEYNDFNEYDYYLNNLTFCGFITLKSILKKNTKNAIRELKKFNCNLIITSGDNEYNCLSVGFDSGIIENKNVFVFDRDENNNKILIRKIYSIKDYDKYNNNINNNDSDTEKNSNETINIVNENNSTKIVSNKFIFTSIFKKKISKNIKDENLVRSSKTKKFLNPYLNFGKKIYKEKIVKNKKVLENTEKENYKNDLLNSELCEINKTDEKDKKSITKARKSNIFKKLDSNNLNVNPNKIRPVKSRQRTDIMKFQDMMDNYSKNKNIYRDELKSKNTFIGDYERFYYYYGIFHDNHDLRDNCIYCVSGKTINYLYSNKKRKECKHLLKQIHKYCKIFFHMTSIDKSISIDFFREFPNSYICKIGECQSDFDPIMSSNVGINLREPKNLNTLLCHFYTIDDNIICIKKIIMEGRSVDENIALMKISSYFCTMIINSYIVTCFYRNREVFIGQLNFLEIIISLFFILSFTSKPDYNYHLNPLSKNLKLLKCHFYTQIIGLFIFKLLSIYFSNYLYKINSEIKIEEANKIFCTYYFILCIELIFSINISFNFISFLKKGVFTNTIFILFILLLLLYFINLISLNSSNFNCDFFKITFFEYHGNLIDSFDDKNRIQLIIICLIDFFVTIFYSMIVYYTFYKIAQCKLSKKNKE